MVVPITRLARARDDLVEEDGPVKFGYPQLEFVDLEIYCDRVWPR